MSVNHRLRPFAVIHQKEKFVQHGRFLLIIRRPVVLPYMSIKQSTCSATHIFCRFLGSTICRAAKQHLIAFALRISGLKPDSNEDDSFFNSYQTCGSTEIGCSQCGKKSFTLEIWVVLQRLHVFLFCNLKKSIYSFSTKVSTEIPIASQFPRFFVKFCRTKIEPTVDSQSCLILSVAGSCDKFRAMAFSENILSSKQCFAVFGYFL